MSPNAKRATLLPVVDDGVGATAVLAVEAAGEVYGFPLAMVREILVPPPITDVPRSADHVLGVITVRGQIITVLDLQTLLNLGVEMDEAYGRVLLVDNGEELVGVAVDRVIHVYRLDQDQIEYANSMSAELSDYVVGVGRVVVDSAAHTEEMLVLIDPMTLLRS